MFLISLMWPSFLEIFVISRITEILIVLKFWLGVYKYVLRSSNLLSRVFAGRITSSNVTAKHKEACDHVSLAVRGLLIKPLN